MASPVLITTVCRGRTLVNTADGVVRLNRDGSCLRTRLGRVRGFPFNSSDSWKQGAPCYGAVASVGVAGAPINACVKYPAAAGQVPAGVMVPPSHLI